MLGPLLALCLSALPAVDENADAAHLVVLHEPLPPGVATTLPRSLAHYGHFGSAAIGEATASQRAALAARDVVLTDLGPWPEGSALVVTPRRSRPAPGTRVLAETHAHRVVAVPDAVRAEHPEWFGGCGHSQAWVERVAWTPTAPFRAPFARDTAAPGAGTAAALAVDPRVATLVEPIDGAAISATVTQLSSYPDRRADGSSILTAKDWLVSQLSAIPGLDSVTTHTFDSGLAPNVVAEITGTTDPDTVVVLGAHYDSINLSGSQFAAPGADDNASGSGGLLEAARVLSAGEFENTIRFVWFSAEEFGLIGAGEYADLLNATPGLDTVAMINMDMIAHRAPGDTFDVDFVTNNTDSALTQFCIDVAQAYTPGLGVKTGVLTAGSSDHAAFSARGIPAAFPFEDLDAYSSVIHTSADTQGSSANDYALAERIATMVAASAALLAEPVDLLVEHTPLADTADAGGPYPVVADVVPVDGSPIVGVDLVWRVDGAPWQTAPLMPGNAPDAWVGSIPGVAPSGLVEYHVVGTNADGFSDWQPAGPAPGDVNHAFEVGSVTTLFAEDFDGPTDAGWTHVELATQDDWQRGVPTGKAGDPGAAYSGSNVWGNDIGPSGFNGEYQSNVSNYLESPSIDCSSGADLQLRFARWLTVEDATYDQATITVDGAQVWQNPVGGGTDHLIDTAWTIETIDVSAQADGDPDVRVRFALESDGGLEFGGWNIDDVSLRTLSDGAVPSLVTDRLFVSAADGGSVQFALSDPALAGRDYALLMGLSGQTPGTPIGQTVLPLAFDALTSIGIGLLGTPVLPGWIGTLSPSGTASASLVSPALPGLGLEGLELTFAFVTTGPVDAASSPATITYVP